jgi:hypothetical protein
MIIQDAQTQRPRLLCFEITVRAKHEVKVAGLKAIWKQIPASAKKLQPALILVVPAETPDSFSAQRIEGHNPQDQEWSAEAAESNGLNGGVFFICLAVEFDESRSTTYRNW